MTTQMVGSSRGRLPTSSPSCSSHCSPVVGFERPFPTWWVAANQADKWDPQAHNAFSADVAARHMTTRDTSQTDERCLL